MTTIRRLFPASRPGPIPCDACQAPYSGTSCPLCKQERPAYTLVKRITAAQRARPTPLQACRYYPGEACGCGQRGECLPAA